MREARGFETGDSRVIAEVVERECRASGDRGCPTELRNESRQLLLEAGRRIQNVLTTLASLNARLQPIRAPKTLVVLSAGLPFDQENLSYFQDLQKRTAESGTSTHVVQLHQPETDASDRRMAGAGRLPASDLYEGLSTIAGVTGGSMSAGVGRAAGVFDRIAAEVTHSWQLGVEASDQDNDGKTHQIQVKLRREGLTVRARRELILPAARTRPTAIDLLSQPVDVLDVPVVRRRLHRARRRGGNAEGDRRDRAAARRRHRAPAKLCARRSARTIASCSRRPTRSARPAPTDRAP